MLVYGYAMMEKELQGLEHQGLLRRLRQVESASASYIQVEGKRYLNLSSNNYLGLSNHPALREAAVRAIQEYGVGTGAAALISGNTVLHRQLARKVAEHKDTQDALIFNTGYMANVGILSALLRQDDRVFVDRLCHASIIDGCRMSKATLRVFPHRDVKTLARHLGRSTPRGRTLIVTDGVFSMDGDLAPLPELAVLAEEHGALLMVDDAHGTGVLGETGRGTPEHFGLLAGQIPIQMGTLSKALGAFGAYVAGSRTLIDYLMNQARSYIYTTALPAAMAAASLAALELIQKEPEIRRRLWDNREYYFKGLRDLGYETLGSETPVIPILIGETPRALAMSRRLAERGIFAPAIRPPTVAEGTARIRTSVMATHSREDLDFALQVLADAGKELGLR